ncbi:MAG: lysophospholipid acyltransferase family protein [Gammaproteobacteria bacterium]|nr:lysophospholipid acyltransferase family protein [Gammaproteobacteria bacterium]
MILLRSLLYFALLMLSVAVFGLVIILLGGLLPGSFSDRVATAWGRTNLWLQRVICGLRYRIVGADNLPDGACIVMAKHQSTWETIALRGLLPPAQSWVLKRELLHLPIFGWGLRFVKSIPIDRSAGRRAVFKVVEDGSARLAEGRCVIIFPEGTRTAPGQRKKYGIGGGVLAERSGHPVVPIAHNAGVFWRRRGVKKYPGEIRVAIGEAIPADGRKAAEIVADVEDWIEAEVAAMPGSVDSS